MLPKLARGRDVNRGRARELGAIALATYCAACGSTAAAPPPDPPMAVLAAPATAPPPATAAAPPSMVMAGAPAPDPPATKEALVEQVVKALVNGSIEQLRELAVSEDDLIEACPGRQRQPGGLTRVERSVERSFKSCSPHLRGRSVRVVEVIGGSERGGDEGCPALRSLANMRVTIEVDGQLQLMTFDDPIYIKDRFYAVFDPVLCTGKMRGMVIEY